MPRGGSQQTSLTGMVGTRRTGLLPLRPHQVSLVVPAGCAVLPGGHLLEANGSKWVQQVGAAQRKFCLQLQSCR